MQPNLIARTTPGAKAESNNGILSLRIPSGPAGQYRLAQFDDYSHTKRSQFPWKEPVAISLKARCSNLQHKGTWGFGLWNDPFSTNLGLAGSARRFPELPDCAWFFYGSPPNHLEFYDRYPAQGFLAATFSSRLIPAPLLFLSLPVIPLLAIPLTARLLRRFLRNFIKQDAKNITIDVTTWHTYRLDWLADQVTFHVDGNRFFQTNVTPQGKTGLVIWIDNQYAAFPGDGRLKFGTLDNPVESSLEISELSIN